MSECKICCGPHNDAVHHRPFRFTSAFAAAYARSWSRRRRRCARIATRLCRAVGDGTKKGPRSD